MKPSFNNGFTLRSGTPVSKTAPASEKLRFFWGRVYCTLLCLFMHLNDSASATRASSLTQIIMTILKSCVSLEWWGFGFGELLASVWIQIGFNLALFWSWIGSMHAPSLSGQKPFFIILHVKWKQYALKKVNSECRWYLTLFQYTDKMIYQLLSENWNSNDISHYSK